MHPHTDVPDFFCELVRTIDEDIPPVYPARMRDGTTVADETAYLAYCARYIP